MSLVMHNTTALTLSCREMCEPFGTNKDCRYPGGPCNSRHLFNSPYLSPSSDSKLPTLYCPIHTIEELSPVLDLFLGVIKSKCAVQSSEIWLLVGHGSAVAGAALGCC